MLNTAHRTPALAAALLIAASGCFPTFQTARIDPGFRVDAGITALGDQPRKNTAQGPDHIAYVIPAYGFGRRLELGVPVGYYLEDGIAHGASNLVAWPYVKLGLLEPASPNHLAVIAQAALIAPGSLGVRYGRNLGKWEPEIGFSYIFSGGPSGDDPVVTRYQELHQTLATLSVGATWNVRGRPAIEIGVLRNAYDEEIDFTPSGAITERRTLYDLFIAMRLGLTK